MFCLAEEKSTEAHRGTPKGSKPGPRGWFVLVASRASRDASRSLAPIISAAASCGATYIGETHQNYIREICDLRKCNILGQAARCVGFLAMVLGRGVAAVSGS